MARLAAASPAECTLATLGSFELRIRGKPIPNPATQKARALLSYLVLHRRTDVPRERLVEVFWAEAEPERARDSLNTALHSIRRGLRAAQFEPNDFIFANKSIIRWEAGVDLDVERIERALQTGDRELADAALAQYHGDFLEGDYDEWTVSERERVAGRYEELLAQTLRSTKAPDVAKKLLARNPYDEDAYATLIDAEVAAGRHFSAAQVIQQCRSALNEIGVVPTAAFLEKYAPLERALAKPPPGLEVPFVGRDAELADLAQFIDRKDADAPSVAIVEGEPGIGKTALIAQAVKRAASSGLRTTSLRAVCDDARPFAIWPALYASLSGKDFEDFLAATHGSVATELAEAIATLLPQPSMLAIDDAQYLSGDALATLIAIAKILAAQRAHVLLIGTRPEGLVQLSEGLGELQYAAVHLQPLPDSDVDTALALAGIEMDAATTTVLRTRARGHPLYLKGLLEQLVRSGALRREGMHWELAQPEADLQLPPSLRRLIEARIRARGSDAVLTACALAIEPSANANEIAQASGLNELAVLDALDDLLGHHVIVEPQSGPRPFIFAHDLLEESALHLLPPNRRARLHAEFARVLLDSPKRGRSIRCAVHFEAAGMFAEAAAAYLQAARDSAEQQAAHDTLERSNSGLRALAELADAPAVHVLASQLHQMRSFAYRLLWQLPECMNAAEESLAHAKAGGDLRCRANALIVLRSANNVGSMDRDRALRVVRELAETAEQLGDNALVVQTLVDEGHTYRISCEFAEAEPCLRRAFDVATRSQRPELIVKAAIQLVSLQTTLWHFDGTTEVIAAIRANDPLVDWPFRAHASLALAMLFTELERYGDADAQLQVVRGTLEAGTQKRLPMLPNVSRPEIAIRHDYFRAVLDARRGDFDAGLARFALYLPMYESLLHEARYRELFEGARIDLLLGRNAKGDAAQAAELLAGFACRWDPETGFEPCHATPVLRARVACTAESGDARALFEQAIGFLEAETARYPYGIDAAYALLAASAASAATGFSERARSAAARLRDQKFTAARDLVSI